MPAKCGSAEKTITALEEFKPGKYLEIKGNGQKVFKPYYQKMDLAIRIESPFVLAGEQQASWQGVKVKIAIAGFHVACKVLGNKAKKLPAHPAGSKF